MTKTKNNQEVLETDEKITHIYCTSCKEMKPVSNFYNTKSVFNSADGKTSICKVCLNALVDENDEETVKRVLRQMDRPFISHIWLSSKSSNRKTFGDYMRQINSLRSFRDMTWEDGLKNEGLDSNESRRRKKTSNEDDYIDEDDNFEDPFETFVLSRELIVKWGSYSKKLIFQMENLWQRMMESFTIDTASKEDYLKKCCITSVLSNDAYENGKITEGDKLSKSYNELMKLAAFSPSLASDNSKTGGVNSFSELFEYIERKGDFIPMWPNVDNDKADELLIMLKRWTRELVMGDPNLANLVENQLKKMNEVSESIDEQLEEGDLE